MYRVVLFDLGDTLVGYFRRSGFMPALRAAVAAAGHRLHRAGIVPGPPADLWARVDAENFEASDGCVRLLEDRLGRVFGFDPATTDPALLHEVCSDFVQPMVDAAELYSDSIPTLDALRGLGVRLGLVSNMPWGSPVEPWARELERHGLTDYFEHTVFCRDIGWRKPSPRIFLHAVDRFGTSPQECLFVGDRPDWDIQGATDAGIPAVLVDRLNHFPDAPSPRIATLAPLVQMVAAS